MTGQELIFEKKYIQLITDTYQLDSRIPKSKFPTSFSVLAPLLYLLTALSFVFARMLTQII